jgi:hypothetical protein
VKARWIRLGELSPEGFDAAVTRLAVAQRAQAAPILAWARAGERYLFALIAPRRLAPGRATRWLPWGVAPAIAAYRQFGLRAYLDGEGIWLHGEQIAVATVREIHECVVVDSDFLARLPSAEMEDIFRLRLEAQHGWQFDHSWPMAHERVDYALA